MSDWHHVTCSCGREFKLRSRVEMQAWICPSCFASIFQNAEGQWVNRIFKGGRPVLTKIEAKEVNTQNENNNTGNS